MNNIRTTALERSVEYTTWGWGEVKALLQLANFTQGPDATFNTDIHKNSVRIKAPNSAMFRHMLSENGQKYTKRPHDHV